MIICKTPFRISFFGGGTDYPAWYLENGGCVISTTIDKYCYVIIKNLIDIQKFSYKIRYYKNEERKRISEISHPTIRECLLYEKIKDPLEVIYFADLPARAGLGSSSSFTVGMLNALRALKMKKINKTKILYDAINIEQKILNESVGSQDQAAAVFGGLNIIKFKKNGEILKKKLQIKAEHKKQFMSHCLLVFSNTTREASKVAEKQIELISDRTNELNEIMNLTKEAVKIFSSKTIAREIGKLLDEQWQLKKKLSPLISNTHIDEIYKTCMNLGAYGGKLLGAGAGGFLLIVAKPRLHKLILSNLKLRSVDFRFDNEGTKLIKISQ